MSGRPKTKRPPVTETSKSWSHFYGSEFFADDSPYFEALRSTDAKLAKVRSKIDETERRQFHTLLVHECEMAKQWQSLWEKKDDPQRATHEWMTASKETLSAITGLAEKLRNLDARQGYDLRYLFYKSAQLAISPEEESSGFMADSNLSDGEFEVPTGGVVAQAIELQLLARLFLVRFDEWTEALAAGADSLHEGFRLGRRIGPIWFDPPLNEKAIFQRNSRQLAILALTGRLRKALGLALQSDGQLPDVTMLLGQLSNEHSPPWQLIYEFVQGAFPDNDEELDLAALKQRWSNATKQRSICLSDWPDACGRQGQQRDL